MYTYSSRALEFHVCVVLRGLHQHQVVSWSRGYHNSIHTRGSSVCVCVSVCVCLSVYLYDHFSLFSFLTFFLLCLCLLSFSFFLSFCLFLFLPSLCHFLRVGRATGAQPSHSSCLCLPFKLMQFQTIRCLARATTEQPFYPWADESGHVCPHQTPAHISLSQQTKPSHNGRAQETLNARHCAPVIISLSF